MSFNEKLQYLRKENKLSQEQLADMLDVTRQSVSKWESGTTYPEMDKLIMLCRIFKCSLDDLTNDEITDIKNVSNKATSNNIMRNLLNSFLEIINKTVKMFRTMTFKQIVGCIVSLLILAVFLAVLRIPFDMLEHSFYGIMRNLGKPALTGAICGLFNLIVDIIYFALYVLVFVYIYKVAYLDKYEFVEAPKNTKKENSDRDDEVKEVYEEKEVIRENVSRVVSNTEPMKENTLFKILGGLVVGFVKFLVAFAAIPAVFLLMMFAFLLVIDIYLMTEGIVYIGTILGLVFAIILAIWFLELLSIFIFNRKASFRRLLWTFIGSIIGISMSFGLFVMELSSIEFIDEPPRSIELITQNYEYDMASDFALRDNYYHYWYNTEYVADETVQDKVRIEISSYGNLVDIGIVENTKAYDIVYYDYYDGINGRTKRLFEMIKENLKEKKLYDYSELNRVYIKVSASKKNIETIKANTAKLYEEERKTRVVCNYDSYEIRISDYADEIDELQEENDALRERIEELEDYKNRVKDILGE